MAAAASDELNAATIGPSVTVLAAVQTRPASFTDA
jgi:hypothetical protein